MNEKAGRAIDNIFRINLGVKKTERVLVFTDDQSSGTIKIARLVAEAGRRFSGDVAYVECRNTGCHGVEPPEEVWAAAFGESTCAELRSAGLFKTVLEKRATEQQTAEVEKIIMARKNEAVNAVIALPYFSTTHTRFRDMLNRICGARYASMPLFDEPMLAGAMTVDWEEMAERTKAIAEILNRCETIEITAPNGTFITFSKKGREAMTDTGIITEAGQFSNLPAGEAFLAPLEGTARGRLVLEWAPTRKLNSPVTVHIENGLALQVEGAEEYAAVLRDKLAEREENRNVAELGIGTNDRASRPDNILESEKISGTVHIALGDNSSFGGRVRTSFHQDFVFFGPAVRLFSADGSETVLLENGKIPGR